LITCASFVRDGPSAGHDLARSFRAGDPVALAAVVELVAGALASGSALDPRRPVHVVTLPGHETGAVNTACDRLVLELAGRFPSMHPVPGALVRIAAAVEAKLGGVRDAAAEAATLSWRTDPLGGDGVILLLDDIVRSGSTFAAAIAAAPTGIAQRIVPMAVFRAIDPAGEP